MAMNRTEKLLFKRTVLLGLSLTLLVIIVDALGLLTPLERSLYDIRARYFQFFMPPPSNRIVHLDIDDETMEMMGAFPWPRTKLAELIDEVNLAKVKVIGLDIIFPDPAEPRYMPKDGGGVEKVDDDQNFADALTRAGNVLVPLSIVPESEENAAIMGDMVRELSKDLELDTAGVAAKLRGTRADTPELVTLVARNFVHARERAVFQRISDELTRGTTDLEALKRTLAPKATLRDEHDEVVSLIEAKLSKVRSVQQLLRFTIPKPPDLPSMLGSDEELVTVESLSKAAAYSGVVDFVPDRDGVVRAVPLFVNYRGRLMPHMALVAACAMLDVKISDIKIAANSVTLPIPNQPSLVIPVQTINSRQFGRVGMFMNIPWFGSSGSESWLTMYDPAHKDPVQHLSVKEIWKIRYYIHQIEINRKLTDETLQAIPYTADKTAVFLRKPVDQRSDSERAEAVEATLAEAAPFVDVPAMEQMEKNNQLDIDGKKLLATYKALLTLRTRNKELPALIQSNREKLRKILEGRYVLFGWTATAKVDFYPTSLHARCPGAVIQGVAVNGILTRQVWRSTWWLTGGAFWAAVIGGLTTLMVAWLRSFVASLGTILLVGSYLIFNGIGPFDYGNVIMPAAGPLCAGVVVWSHLTLAQYIYENRERTRITRRFSSYVDPVLVNYVVENPESARFDGQIREMTVVFTDLAGFTTVSEKLRERTVPLLNEYMSLMLPIIRQNRGYWNKFLGDGIMFFYNAPSDNPKHAPDAVRTVLQMQNVMEEFNQRLFKRGLPQVAMRAGLATGMMVVGDAGSTDAVHHASDYTVLGDEVNLGARLESANKAFGSRVLMSERTAELAGAEFLLRPMGKLQVMGKTQGVMTYEAMCLSSEAQDQHKRTAEWSVKVVEHFRAARFDPCLEAARKLEEHCGSTKFTQLYLKLSKEYLIAPPENGFDGQIVLDSK